MSTQTPPTMTAVDLPINPPVLRGVLHGVAAVAAVFGGVWLLIDASSPAGYVGAAIFATSLMLLYGTSATYHRPWWGPTPRRIIKRIDHAMIFVLIAGTYTPFCLDVSLAWGIPMLAVVWTIAGIGALIKVIWPDAPRWLGVGLYLGLGWVALVAASEVLTAYSFAPIALLLGGGLCYTAGALVYAFRRPDPSPRIFGYHEVFHVLVVAGSVFHYTAIMLYVV